MQESTRRASFSRLATLRKTFLKKNSFFIYCLGECVYQISGLFLFSFGHGMWHKQTKDMQMGVTTACTRQVNLKINLLMLFWLIRYKMIDFLVLAGCRIS